MTAHKGTAARVEELAARLAERLRLPFNAPLQGSLLLVASYRNRKPDGDPGAGTRRVFELAVLTEGAPSNPRLAPAMTPRAMLAALLLTHAALDVADGLPIAEHQT